MQINKLFINQNTTTSKHLHCFSPSQKSFCQHDRVVQNWIFGSCSSWHCKGMFPFTNQFPFFQIWLHSKFFSLVRFAVHPLSDCLLFFFLFVLVTDWTGQESFSLRMLWSSSVVKSISSSSTSMMRQLPGPVDPDALLSCLLLLFHILLELTIFGICNIIMHLLQHNSYFHDISTSLILVWKKQIQITMYIWFLKEITLFP